MDSDGLGTDVGAAWPDEVGGEASVAAWDRTTSQPEELSSGDEDGTLLLESRLESTTPAISSPVCPTACERRHMLTCSAALVLATAVVVAFVVLKGRHQGSDEYVIAFGSCTVSRTDRCVSTSFLLSSPSPWQGRGRITLNLIPSA